MPAAVRFVSHTRCWLALVTNLVRTRWSRGTTGDAYPRKGCQSSASAMSGRSALLANSRTIFAGPTTGALQWPAPQQQAAHNSNSRAFRNSKPLSRDQVYILRLHPFRGETSFFARCDIRRQTSSATGPCSGFTFRRARHGHLTSQVSLGSHSDSFGEPPRTGFCDNNISEGL